MQAETAAQTGSQSPSMQVPMGFSSKGRPEAWSTRSTRAT